MKSHIIPLLLLLIGIICAPLIAAHSHDWFEEAQEGKLEPFSGSDNNNNNSAEEFMNEMEALVKIWEEEHNETLSSSGDYIDEEEFLGPRIKVIGKQ